MRARPLVLVCEDSDEDFDTLSDVAREAGIEADLHRTTSGGSCLSFLRGNGDEKLRPTVVLMDLNTPGIDGREALQEIKTDPHLRDLPVIVLTTSSNPSDLAFCYWAGANAYHVKPLRYNDHMQVIREMFHYWLDKVTLTVGEANGQ